MQNNEDSRTRDHTSGNASCHANRYSSYVTLRIVSSDIYRRTYISKQRALNRIEINKYRFKKIFIRSTKMKSYRSIPDYDYRLNIYCNWFGVSPSTHCILVNVYSRVFSLWSDTNNSCSNIWKEHLYCVNCKCVIGEQRLCENNDCKSYRMCFCGISDVFPVLR